MKNTAKSSFTTVITVDPSESIVSFSYMSDGNAATLTRETKKCKTKLFDEEFFQTFTKLVTEYSMEHPSAQAANVTLVLPDRAVATDVLSIPTLRRKQIEESLVYAINDMYKNHNDLKINRYMLMQNKQYTSFALSMIQSSLITSFYTVFSTCKMIPQAITYASNSSVNAAISFNPKLNGSTFMLMDIKSSYTRISFVAKGTTCGFYTLPFGYSILERNRLAAEDMLFDHSQAELLVLNAKEKAKTKQLTMMGNDNSSQIAQEMIDEQEAEAKAKQKELQEDKDEFDEEEDYEEETTTDVFTASAAASRTSTVIKTLPKKQPRKLPKFMLRPAPHSDEEYAFENFRIFVKWALNLIQSNRRMIWQTKPDCVYVNMPEEYRYILDTVNGEKKENGIEFLPLELQGAGKNISDYLEEFGGFYAVNYNTVNNF